MAADDADRTYGNWRRPTSPGLGQLGMLGTGLLFVGLIATVIGMMISFWAGLGVVVVLAAVVAPLLIKDRHGRHAAQRFAAWMAWRRGRSAGWHLYRSGPLGLSARDSFRLPGLLAASRVYEALDSYGRPFAMIEMPSTGHYSVVFECGADGAGLVDPDQIDTWVAYWGQWLAALAYEPGLVSGAVTIETAPDLGHRLREEVSANAAPDAPALARQVLDEIVDTYPAGSAQISSRVALTYAAAPRPGAQRRSVQEMAREIGTRLPNLGQSLAMTGAGTARPMTADGLAQAVRIAYDPAAQAGIEQANSADGPSQDWANAGPAGHQEAWDHYRHDSGVSITWGWSEAPRGVVVSSVLTGLLAPHRDIARKRVTLTYRPHDPATAARIVENDRRTARFRISSPNAAARDSIAVSAADQSAREEARGAGVERFAMLVTATVITKDRGSAEVRAALDAASAAVDSLAPPARVQLRRLYGAQSAGFAACLPLGVVLPDHVQLPQWVQDAV